MLKNILKYSSIELIAKGLNKLVLFLLPLFLDSINYGIVGLLLAIELFLPLIMLLGFERVVLRFYSEKLKFPNFKGTIFNLISISALFALSILGGLYLSGIKDFFLISIFPDFFLIIILIYFQNLYLINLNMLRVDEKHSNYFRVKLIYQIIKLFSIFSFVIITKDYFGYIFASIFSISITVFIYFSDSIYLNFKRFNKETFKKFIYFSWPFIMSGVASGIITNIDKFFIESYMSINDVAFYTLAYSFGATIMFSYIGVSVYMEPLIYRQNNQKDKNEMLNKYFFFTSIFGIFSFLLLTLASNFLLPIFYSSEYKTALEYIPLIGICFLLSPHYLKANYDMIFEQKVKKIALISILCAVANVVLNYLLIPIYGLKGAVLAFFVSSFLQTSLYVIYAKGNKFKKDLSYLLALIIILFLYIFYNMDLYLIILMLFTYLCIYLVNNNIYKWKK